MHIPELAQAGVQRFAIRRTGSGTNDHTEGLLIMRGGDVVISRVGPLDVIYLHSLKK